MRFLPVPTGLALTGAAMALAPTAAFAHHSRAPYDMTQEVVIEGTVVDLSWKNPHIYMTVEIAGPDGQPAQQEIEVVSVSEARALGLVREAIEPGAHVVVRANPGRDGPLDRASGIDVRTADDVVYPLNTDAKFIIPPPPAAPADGIGGTWATTVESFIAILMPPADPSAGPQLTEAGLAGVQANMARLGGADAAALGICEPFPPPLLLVFPEPRTIEIGDTSIVMRAEGSVGLPMERVIHLDQTEHPADVEPSLMGHSIGRWEGETLVIDTTAFAPHQLGSLLLPSSAGKHLIERLALSDDRLHLDYSATIEDPDIIVGSWSFAMTWDYRPDLSLSGEACDPDIAEHPLEEEPLPPPPPPAPP